MVTTKESPGVAVLPPVTAGNSIPPAAVARSHALQELAVLADQLACRWEPERVPAGPERDYVLAWQRECHGIAQRLRSAPGFRMVADAGGLAWGGPRP